MFLLSEGVVLRANACIRQAWLACAGVLIDGSGGASLGGSFQHVSLLALLRFLGVAGAAGVFVGVARRPATVLVKD